MYAAAKSLQSCSTLCDPIDSSPPGSPVPGILQARTLEWVVISFSSAWRWKGKVKSLSHVRLLATPWTAAYQAPPSMGFSRQEYLSGVPYIYEIWKHWCRQLILPTKHRQKHRHREQIYGYQKGEGSDGGGMKRDWHINIIDTMNKIYN